MEVTHGYQYDKLKGHPSPNGTWYKAEANDKKYFLKKFKDPIFPREGANPKLYAEMKSECDTWLAAKKKLIKALDELGNGTGNIISPRDVFRDKLCFYQATYWIDVQTDSLDRIKRYSYDDKIMLLKTYSAALKKVHSKEIIHGDLKPDNILIGKSAAGRPVAKLIDFDDSYFSKQALSPNLTVVTDAYQSPELAAYKRGNEEYRERLTCASDVFASGIIFHQFWCGEMPEYPGNREGKFVFEAVASGQKCTLDNSLPDWLQRLVQAMLSPMPENRPTMEEVHVAVSEQKFGEKEPAPSPVGENKVDYTQLDKVWSHIPADLSGYTSDTVKILNETCEKISRIRSSADQATINKCAKVLYSALKNLKKAQTVAPSADYSKIDKILAAVPKNLSEYTAESATKLKKVIRYIESNRNLQSQEEVDKLTKFLYVALKGLQMAPDVDDPTIPFKPASPLPKGYSKVKIISADKVCVYTTSGSKMTIPRVSAQSMGLVVPK